MVARVISFFNQKGGVAKTTSCAHLAKALARKDLRVLAIDLDPQANLSQLLGNAEPSAVRVSIYDALRANPPQIPLSNVISQTEDPHIHLCYGSLDLAGLDLEIRLRSLEPASILRKALDQGTKEAYDFILLDNAPSLSMVTINSLVASDFYIVPIGAGDSFALAGVKQLKHTIDMVHSTHSDLQLLGVLLTRYDGRLTICKSLAFQVTQAFGKYNVFDSQITTNTLVEQATALRKTIYELDSRAPAAKDYNALANEVIERCGRLAPESRNGKAKEQETASTR